MAQEPSTYTGRLGRDADGVYRGSLVDPWGFEIRISAEVIEVAGRKEFALRARMLIPATYRVPYLDGAPEDE